MVRMARICGILTYKVKIAIIDNRSLLADGKIAHIKKKIAYVCEEQDLNGIGTIYTLAFLQRLIIGVALCETLLAWKCELFGSFDKIDNRWRYPLCAILSWCVT